jgi:ABC-2 type transport system permease protein
MRERRRRLQALVKKEFVQVLRDPSSLLIAFVLPLILLFLFGYGVSLDARRIRLGVALQDRGAAAHSLAAAYAASPWFDVRQSGDPRVLLEELLAGRLRGVLVIPQDFSRRRQQGEGGLVQLLADGSETNTANYVENYARGVLGSWQEIEGRRSATMVEGGPELVPRIWFNPELESRHSLLPGAIGIILAIIGTLLTALVVAREWERGTMEALMATPVGMGELLVGKLVPYFLLGQLALLGSLAVAVLLFRVPFRGSAGALLLTSSAFLLAALGQGLLISTLAKNQFIAAQAALVSGFLPAFLLSGFVFEIASMPLPIRILTRIIPARYLVNSLQTLFLVGDVWPLLGRNILVLLLLAAIFFGLTARKTVKRLR